MACCSRKTEWGRCQQPAVTTLCSAHKFWREAKVTPDPYYERKIVLGLTSPTWDWMSEAEGEIVVNGRYRGDGRRLDQWVSAEPLLYDTGRNR